MCNKQTPFIEDTTPILETELQNSFVFIFNLMMTNAWVIILCCFYVAPGTKDTISAAEQERKRETEAEGMESGVG